MARITGSIPNLFNGVSQQTPALRLPTQGTEQLNLYPSLVQGLVKRPPMEIVNDDIKSTHLSKYGTAHLIDRGSDLEERERCFIYVTPKGIVAFRPDGTQKEVRHEGGALAYLAKGGTTRYAICTIADHTFISNPAVNVEMSPAKTPPSNGCGFVQVKQAAYETEYGIDITLRKSLAAGEPFVQTISAKCKTWSSLGTVDDPKPKVTIDRIVAKLLYELIADKVATEYANNNSGEEGGSGGGGSSGGNTEQTEPGSGGGTDTGYHDNEHDHVIVEWDAWESDKRRGKKEDEKETTEGEDDDPYFDKAVSSYIVKKSINFRAVASGSVIYICPNEGWELVDIHATDSEGDQMTRAILDETARFSDLPSKCVDGTIVKITGDDTTRFNDYYVMFHANDKKVTSNWFVIYDGAWKECPAPGIPYVIHPDTMPHILVDKGSHFVFKVCTDWADRTCGDDDTCPLPEFIGYPITGIFQWRNRLGFLSQDVVALSEASEYFNWWNTTVLTQVDSDPIYLSASVEGAPMLRWALPFNEEIILFSDRAQFKLVAPEVLSPASAAVNTVSYYSMNNDIKPVSSGRNIFFADTQEHTALQRSTRVYEYYIDADTGTKDAMEVTSHVPQYISSKVTDMVCSTGLDLLVLFQQDSNEMWAYKYYWSGNEKLQTAWGLFQFGQSIPRNVLGAVFIGDVLYLLVWSKDRYYLCKMDFSITLDRSSIEHGQGPEPFPFYLDMLNDWTFKGQYLQYDNKTLVQIPDYYDKETVAIIDVANMREIERAGYDEHGHIALNGKYDDVAQLKIGETYPSVYTFSRVFVRGTGQDGQSQLTSHMGLLMLQHWRLILGPTGFIEALVEHDDGRTFRYRHTHLYTSYPEHLLGRANRNEFKVFDFPIRGDAAHITVKLSNPTWWPSSVISAEWDGNYITKGRQRI